MVVGIGAAASFEPWLKWKNSCIVLFLMREEGVLRCELQLLLSFLPDWHDSEASFSLSLSAMVLPGVRHCSF